MPFSLKSSDHYAISFLEGIKQTSLMPISESFPLIGTTFHCAGLTRAVTTHIGLVFPQETVQTSTPKILRHKTFQNGMIAVQKGNGGVI
jgi:hypothetical protein